MGDTARLGADSIPPPERGRSDGASRPGGLPSPIDGNWAPSRRFAPTSPFQGEENCREDENAGRPQEAGRVGAEANILPLLAWLSPAFPVGAYAYSHGLEWAVEAGDLKGEAAVLAHVADVLRQGAGRNDAIFLIEAARAVHCGGLQKLAAVNDLALAYAPSRELLLETSQQGRSFLDAVSAAWPAPHLVEAAAVLGDEVAYPVAVGVAVAAHGIPLEAAAAAYLLAFAQNLVSAAVRLGAIGQTAAARIIAGLAPLASSLSAEVQGLTTEDLGSATFRADLGSFLHETQYTRLFRS